MFCDAAALISAAFRVPRTAAARIAIAPMTAISSVTTGSCTDTIERDDVMGVRPEWPRVRWAEHASAAAAARHGSSARARLVRGDVRRLFGARGNLRKPG